MATPADVLTVEDCAERLMTKVPALLETRAKFPSGEVERTLAPLMPLKTDTAPEATSRIINGLLSLPSMALVPCLFMRNELGRKGSVMVVPAVLLLVSTGMRFRLLVLAA